MSQIMRSDRWVHRTSRENLCVAALTVCANLHGVNGAQMRGGPGASTSGPGPFYVKVPFVLVEQLLSALDDAFPGAVDAAYSNDFLLPAEEQGGTIGRLAEAARQIARDIRLEHLYAMTGRAHHNPESYESPERVKVQDSCVHALAIALEGIYPIVPGSSGNRWQQSPYDGPIKVSAAPRLVDEPHIKPWTERVWGLYDIPVRQLTEAEAHLSQVERLLNSGQGAVAAAVRAIREELRQAIIHRDLREADGFEPG